MTAADEKWLALPLEERVAVVPDHVAIVAMGRSHATYTSLAASRGDWKRVADETWVINGMAGLIGHHRAFIMDDLKRITAPAAERKPGGCAEGMLGWLARHPGPVYSSRAYPEYPGVVEYPLQHVLNRIGFAYLNTTVAYTVAYAMAHGVKKMTLYGCDFSYPDNNHISESGRACVEFLLGMAIQGGMAVEVASDSTLLDASAPSRFYGFPDPPKVTRENDLWVVEHTDDRAG